MNLFFKLLWSESNSLVNMSEILWSISGVSNSSVTYCDFMLDFLDNDDFNNTTAFCDLAVKRFKANKWVLYLDIVIISLFIDLTLSTFEFNELLIFASFSVSELF